MNSSNRAVRILGITALNLIFLFAANRPSLGQTPTPSPSPSPSPTPSPTAAEIDRLLTIYNANSRNNERISDLSVYQPYLALSKGALQSVMTSAEQQRVDVQTATSAGSGAATSAASTGSVPWLFGFAVEHGALTQSVDNNVITFKGNVANVVKAINTRDYIESYRKYQDDTVVNLISQASFSVSFVSGQGSGSTTNNQGTLAGYSAHIDLYNHRDPRDKKYIGDWDSVRNNLTEVASRSGGINRVLRQNHAAAVGGWKARTSDALKKITPQSTDAEVREIIQGIADDYVSTFGQFPDVQGPLKAFEQAMKDYAEQKGNVIDKIENSPILSVEYTNTRQSVTTALPQSTSSTTTVASPLPDLSNINLIYGFRFISKSQATFNAGATFFNSLPAGSTSGSVRDWRVSGQVDIPLPELPEIGKSTLTFSGLFLSLLEEPLGQKVLVNGVAESRTGNIGLFQAKFSVPVKGAGIKIPISLTASNRTELIKETDVRGSVGITLDLDSIFAKSAGGK